MSSDKLPMKRKSAGASAAEENSKHGAKETSATGSSKKQKLSVEEQRERARKWAEETLHLEATPEKAGKRRTSRGPTSEAHDSTPEKPRRNSANNLKQLAREAAVAETVAEESLKARRRSAKAAEATEAAAKTVANSEQLDAGVKTKRSEAPVTRRRSAGAAGETSGDTSKGRRTSKAATEDSEDASKPRRNSANHSVGEGESARRQSKFDSPSLRSIPRNNSFTLVGFFVDVWAAGWDFYWYHYKVIVAITILGLLGYLAHHHGLHVLSVDELVALGQAKVMQLRDASIAIFSGVFGILFVLYVSSAIYKRRQR